MLILNTKVLLDNSDFFCLAHRNLLQLMLLLSYYFIFAFFHFNPSTVGIHFAGNFFVYVKCGCCEMKN